MEHHFNIEDAKKYGIECAILLYNIRYWIDKNKANGKHFYNGMFWTYNSSTAFAKLFPYLSSTQIARHLRKLEEIGVLVSGNFNTVAYDKTKWYSILNYDDSDLNNPCTKMNNDTTVLNNGSFKSVQPIPDIKTDTKQSNNKPDIFQKKSFKTFSIEDFQNEIKLNRGAANFSAQDCIDFHDYWTETDANGKMRFTREITWNTDKRMLRWKKNDRTQINGQKTSTKTTKEDVMNGGKDLLLKYAEKEAQQRAEKERILNQ